MPYQSDLRFTFVPSCDTAHFEVIEFTLKEGVSRPFRLSLKLSSDDPDIDFAALLDKPALFTLWRDEEPVRHVHGVISSLTLGSTGFHRTHYHAVVEPALARLALCSDWRIFQGKSVPQIIDTMLKEHGIRAREKSIIDPHEAREYCVQAGETDLHFLTRLAAEEGLVYTFHHTTEGHELVYCDRATGLGLIGPEHDCSVIHEASPGGEQALPALWRFSYTEQVRTARQVQRDYTFTNPRYKQQHEVASNDVQHQSDRYERFDYPGRYKRDVAGKPFTGTRLLALRNDARQAEAEGDDARLQPGLSFKLQDHPREAFNTWWRTISLEHHGVQHTSQEQDASDSQLGTRYTQTALLVDSAIEWKADLLPRPRIDGPQTATVVGPKDEEIYCDQWGRVKVSFPWDRESKNNDASSCWVRVAQGWAGMGWGAMAIPRIGQELIISYLDGDPDQPIATGRAYREGNRPPYELPRHKTRMTIRSQSHKGGGKGFNELRFEDERGQEEVFIHAERDQNNVVRHDESTEVGNDRGEKVGHDETIDIGHDRTETVGNDERVTVGQDRQQEIGRDNTLSIGQNHSITIGLDRTEQVGNHRRDMTTANHWIEVGGHLEQQVEGHVELRAGQAIRQFTQVGEVHAAQSMTFKTPGGMLHLDASGITVEGLSIQVLGPMVQIPIADARDLSAGGDPATGESVCVSCLLKAIGENRSLIRMEG